MKISIIEVISWLFIIREEVNTAYRDDNKIDAKEIINMYKNITKRVNLSMKPGAQKTIDLVSTLINEVENIVVDNKVSIKEIIVLAETVCKELNYDLDMEGFIIGK